jgi:ATP-binding cassette subfamily B protein
MGISEEAQSGAIEFRNVSFTYPDSGVKALTNLSFKIESGKSLAIIGRTGSGKTTIANLICRLYDATEGEILIGGKNIKDWDLHLLRRQIGYVPQDSFLFSDTIESNIAFGSRHTTDTMQIEKDVIDSAKVACIYNEIMSFPNGFETMIGERGITLSGGQKQRIAIARAIISSPPILIFDDCFSAVDTETEAEILRNLGVRVYIGNKGNKGNKRTSPIHTTSSITILISHRVSTVKDASHIIVLEQGKIKEEGTHQQLMARKGFYFDLYNIQLESPEYSVNNEPRPTE